MIPDFAAARVSASLVEIEAAVAQLEARRNEVSFEKAACAQRPDIEPPGAIRWLRRRQRWVASLLAALVGLAPELLAGCELSLASARRALGADCLLVRAREIAVLQLQHLPAPVGLAPLAPPGRSRAHLRQHKTGADPPSAHG